MRSALQIAEKGDQRMASYDLLGWNRHVVVDSRRQLAIVRVTVAVRKVTARALRKVPQAQRHISEGSGARFPETDLGKFRDGAWTVIVVDHRGKNMYQVTQTNDGGDSRVLLLSSNCKSTADDIAKAVSRGLERAAAGEFPPDVDDVHELEFSDGSVLKWSPTYVAQCLSGLVFRQSDGPVLAGLAVSPGMLGYVASRRDVIGP